MLTNCTTSSEVQLKNTHGHLSIRGTYVRILRKVLGSFRQRASQRDQKAQVQARSRLVYRWLDQNRQPDTPHRNCK